MGFAGNFISTGTLGEAVPPESPGGRGAGAAPLPRRAASPPRGGGGRSWGRRPCSAGCGRAEARVERRAAPRRPWSPRCWPSCCCRRCCPGRADTARTAAPAARAPCAARRPRTGRSPRPPARKYRGAHWPELWGGHMLLHARGSGRGAGDLLLRVRAAGRGQYAHRGAALPFPAPRPCSLPGRRQFWGVAHPAEGTRCGVVGAEVVRGFRSLTCRCLTVGSPAGARRQRLSPQEEDARPFGTFSRWAKCCTLKSSCCTPLASVTEVVRLSELNSPAVTGRKSCLSYSKNSAL